MHKILALLIGGIIAVAIGGWILTRFQFSRNLIFGDPTQKSGMFQP